MNQEAARLQETRTDGVPWEKWGPYLAERQWGAVREDYSLDGNAWDYFTKTRRVRKPYHSGADGIAGLSDDRQILCFRSRSLER